MGPQMVLRRIPKHALLILFAFAVFSQPYINHLHAKENLNTSLRKAESLYNKKKFSEALRLYENIIVKDPSVIRVYRGIINCYTALGDPQGAVIFVESLYLENPESAEVCYGLGYSLFHVKKYKEAKIYFEKAIKLNPNIAEAWNNCAAIYHFVLNDYEKAYEYYKKAVSISKRTGNDRVLEIAQENLAHLPKKEVIQPVTEALSLEEFVNRFVASVDQKDEKGIKGLVLGQKENSEKAMDWLLGEALRQFAEEKEEEKTTILLAKLLEKEYRESFKSDILKNKLDTYMNLSDEKKFLHIQGETLLKEGFIKEKNGEYSDAIVHYKEALSSFQSLNDKSNTGLSYIYLGDVYLKIKKFVLARKAYDNGLTCFIETGEEERKALVLSSLGKTCFQSGNYKDALDFLKRSLEAYRVLKDEASERKIEKNIELVMAKIKEKP